MLEEAKDTMKNVERRKVPGGPAKATVLKNIAAEKKRLDIDRKAMAGLQEKLDTADRELSKAIGGIISR
jgi:hypothetical protein